MVQFDNWYLLQFLSTADLSHYLFYPWDHAESQVRPRELELKAKVVNVVEEVPPNHLANAQAGVWRTLEQM